jgi:hypothetical protein
MNNKTHAVPQMRVHTNLIAGESVQACQRNLESWRKQLEQKCNRNSGYQPYRETEMQWWQAGDV